MSIILKNFIKLAANEIDLVYNSRNNEKVRRYCKNKEKISYKNHIDFIKNLENINSQYFLVYVYDLPIGVISFADITESSLFVGSYKIKNSIKLSAIYMEYAQFYYAFEVLKKRSVYAEVFYDNKKVLNYQLDHCMVSNMENRLDICVFTYSSDLYFRHKNYFINSIEDIFENQAVFDVVII